MLIKNWKRNLDLTILHRHIPYIFNRIEKNNFLIHTHTHTNTHTHKHTHTCVCVCVSVYECVYVCVYIFKFFSNILFLLYASIMNYTVLPFYLLSLGLWGWNQFNIFFFGHETYIDVSSPWRIHVQVWISEFH